MIAALDGKIGIGQVLIEWGADLNKRNKGGYTALSLAALTGHAPFIGLLLRSGASLDCYPFGRSLDGYLDWLEKYGGRSKEQMRNIRQEFDLARKTTIDKPVG